MDTGNSVVKAWGWGAGEWRPMGEKWNICNLFNNKYTFLEKDKV